MGENLFSEKIRVENLKQKNFWSRKKEDILKPFEWRISIRHADMFATRPKNKMIFLMWCELLNRSLGGKNARYLKVKPNSLILSLTSFDFLVIHTMSKCANMYTYFELLGIFSQHVKTKTCLVDLRTNSKIEASLFSIEKVLETQCIKNRLQ